MQLSAEHYRETERAIAAIREIEARAGVTREALGGIQERLVQLAARTDLFTPERFPTPGPDEKTTNFLYRVSEDADHRFALYVNASRGKYRSPVHNHTTWAVIAGITGQELNRMYDRTAQGGVTETGQKMVHQGASVAFLPDDLHAIQIDEPLINFHLYGLGLEQLVRREYYKPEENRWAIFAHFAHIREARQGRA